MKKHKNFIQFDLIMILLLFMFISLIAIYNAQQFGQYAGSNFVVKQAIWFLLGIFILIVFQFFDLRQLQSMSMMFYIIGLLSLLILIITPESFAPVINNAKSWFKFGSVTIQPSEFTKVTTILYCASVVSKHNNKYEIPTVKSDIFLLLKLLLIGLLPIALILQQPDFGSSMVFLFITGIFILISGINWRLLFIIIFSTIIILVSIFSLFFFYPDKAQSIFHIEDYQMDRITTWMEPSQDSSDEEYHITKSLLAIGSGQIYGKGLKENEVYIPEAQTDFIFSVIGESFGFVGASFVIVLYFLLIYKVILLAIEIHKSNIFGALLCIGFGALIFIHTFQNIGMTVGVMPITGIPLLMVSYGGSSVLASLFGFSLIYLVKREYIKQKSYLFK